MNQLEIATETIRLLHRTYPDANCTLNFDQPWHLLVAAILAAQCTDARVNQVTPALFAKYPALTDLAVAGQSELEEQIRSCGLFRNKARAIRNSSRALVEQYGGELPRTLEALTALPGIGRKIANLILGDCFGIPAIVVDTHCARISHRIGLTDKTSPEGVEKDLAAIIPANEQIAFGHLMVSHGRAICLARRPNCPTCPLQDFCRTSLDMNRVWNS